MQARRDWLAAVALACAFAFTGLGNHPLRAADEPRVAGLGWEAQHTGEWLVPHLGGELFLEQPPLFYAALGACIRLFGATEGVARLPGAIASALTLLAVFGLGRRLADRTAGFAALLALVAIAGFTRYSHRAVVDPMLALFVMLGFGAYVRAVWDASPPPGGRDAGPGVSGVWLVAVYAAAALAYWVKGFVGVIAVGGPCAIDVLAARRWRALLSPAHLVGLPLLCAAVAAWPLVLQLREGEEAYRTFVLNNGLYRVLPGAGGASYTGGHENPFWYYLPKVPGQLGATLVFVPALAVGLRRGRLPAGWNRDALRFLAWVFPIGVGLLSFPGTKRGLYLLPFEPPLAVALGAWLSVIRRPQGPISGIETATVQLCAWVMRALSRPAAWLARAGGAPGAAAQTPGVAPLRVAAVGFAIAVAWNVLIYPFGSHSRDLGPLAREVDARVGDATLAGFRLEESMRGALGFYAGRIPVPVQSGDELARGLAGRGFDYLLVPAHEQPRVAAAAGTALRPAAAWHEARRDYELYAVAGPGGPAADARPSREGDEPL